MVYKVCGEINRTRIIYDTIETIFRSIFHEDSEKIGGGDSIEVHHVRFERFLWDVNT